MPDLIDRAASPGPRPAENRFGLTPTQRRSVLLLTAGALALYLGMRWLPTGTNLSHMDFRVEGKGAIEMCDPSAPQFIPVVAARSPVELTLKTDGEPALGRETRFTLMFRTAGGKPIGPEDLAVAHTSKLHLLIVDPTLSDYQHIHPEPGRRAGEWVFTLRPQRAGQYRVFADFVPVATQRGLYASVDFTVPGAVARVTRTPTTSLQSGRFRYDLDVPPLWRANVPVELTFRIESVAAQKTPVPLEPVMDAFAHLVTFDEARSGFAHLHPKEIDLSQPPDPFKPELHFQVAIPQAGRYVIWAQVKVGGEETFVPFWIDVLP